MTGYGKAGFERKGIRYTIEIKTLNSKTMDISLRLPGLFREYEMEIRSLVSASLERGKAEVAVSVENIENSSGIHISKEKLASLYRELESVYGELGLTPGQELIPALLRMPDVMQTPGESLDPTEWEEAITRFRDALDAVNDFRMQEGVVLESDLQNRIEMITERMHLIVGLEKERSERIREKLRGEVERFFIGANAPQFDANRFEQEMIYYLEKLDITEELIRLKKHCQFFQQNMQEESSNGRKLGFILQEMGREINTIGSKANDAEIQKIVVEMKDELEKMKEQILNIL